MKSEVYSVRFRVGTRAFDVRFVFLKDGPRTDRKSVTAKTTATILRCSARSGIHAR